MSRQLGIDTTTDLTGYRDGKWRFAHAAQIRTEHGYRDLADRAAGFGLTRWLYAQCWTGTERPSALFDRATTWMLAHKVLLPGATTLERFVATLRHRVDVRVWRVLASGISPPQQRRLEDLLRVPDEGRSSSLVTLRTGAAMVSGPALVRALERLNAVRRLSITVPAAAAIAPTRIAALARFAENAKVPAVARLPALRRAATSAVVTTAWRRYVYGANDAVDHRAYTFCVLDQLREALRRRDVFVTPSWRYADPRRNLLAGAEWEAARPIMCRTLGYSPRPEPILAALSDELDQTYRAVAARLPNNPAVRFERIDGKDELIVSPLDKVEEPASLVALRTAIADGCPVSICRRSCSRSRRVQISPSRLRTSANARRGHGSWRQRLRRAAGGRLQHRPRATRAPRDSELAARSPVLGQPALPARRDLARGERAPRRGATGIPLARAWGGGEVASADGLRFVVPVRTVHAGPNPKYFGIGRGVTYYNLVSDQFTGLHGITVPGTLRDSLVLLAVALEQQTELQPTQIMTDTGAYSDVVFGLFRLLGDRFSPRLADIGGTRFWRIDSRADYGPLNRVARQSVNLDRITPQWDDMLRTVGSLKLGRVPATGIMRTLQVGDRPTRLAQAFAEFGRIDKTIHTLTYLDDEAKRRATLIQLNRGEGRHALARAVFHGNVANCGNVTVKARKTSSTHSASSST